VAFSLLKKGPGPVGCTKDLKKKLLPGGAADEQVSGEDLSGYKYKVSKREFVCPGAKALQRGIGKSPGVQRRAGGEQRGGKGRRGFDDSCVTPT